MFKTKLFKSKLFLMHVFNSSAFTGVFEIFLLRKKNLKYEKF